MSFILIVFFMVMVVIIWWISVSKNSGIRAEWLKLRQIYLRLQRNETHSKVSRLYHTSPGLAGLWHQLLIRVNFDIEAAEKMIQDLRREYPNQKDRWYIHKAILRIEAEKLRYTSSSVSRANKR
jgi:hypothetical protein